jgi:hypothetical protein
MTTKFGYDFVNDCGADPTGAAPSDAAVQQLYALIRTREATLGRSLGATVFIPSGNYKFTQPWILQRPLRIVGEGESYCTNLSFANYQDAGGVWRGGGFQMLPAVMTSDGGSGAGSCIERLSIACAILPVALFVVGAQATVGQLLMVDDARWYYEVTVAGVLGAKPTPPSDDNDSLDTPIRSGTATIVTRVHAGVLMRTRGHVEHVVVSGSTNAGVHIQSDGEGAADDTNCNRWGLRTVDITDCGEGFVVVGGDTQAGLALAVSCYGIGYANLPNVVPAGYRDGSFLGNTHVAPFVENIGGITGPQGQSYVFNSADAQNLVLGAYSEDTLAGVIAQSTIFIGGDRAAGIQPLGGPVQTGHLWSRVQFVDRASGAVVLTCLDDGVTVGGWYGKGQTQAVSWLSGEAHSPDLAELQYGAANRTAAIGVTREEAAEGPGHTVFSDGYFQFVNGVRFWRGGQQSLNDKRVRGGLRKVGDRFYNGDDTETRITSDGYRAPLWVANTGYRIPYAPYGMFADLVLASDGNIYRCITTGVSGATQPTWSAAGTVQDGTAVWQYVGVPATTKIVSA